MAALIICVIELNTHLLQSLFLFVKWLSIPICWFRIPRCPRLTNLGRKYRDPAVLTLGTLDVVSTVRSHPLISPVIGSSTLRLWKCNKQSCPHNLLVIIVIMYGLYMQKSFPEGIEMGDIIGGAMQIAIQMSLPIKRERQTLRMKKRKIAKQYSCRNNSCDFKTLKIKPLSLCACPWQWFHLFSCLSACFISGWER